MAGIGGISRVNYELSEVILSSTSTSITSIHSLSTSSLLFNYKSLSTQNNTPSSSDQSTSTPTTSSTSASTPTPNSITFHPASNGEQGFILALTGKDARQAINLYGFHKEQVIQRFIPPVRLSVLSISSSALYLAGGTLDGRILLWDLPTGNLLATLDAHYRSVSVLKFSNDDAALISASEDAGVSVWSLGSLLGNQSPPTPFATLSDHTLPITDVAIGIGCFPKLRVLTASADSTCKIWDLSTTPPSLLSTFSFPSPITHITWDPIERFFFAVHPSTEGGGSTVQRVNLYKQSEEETGFIVDEAIGGGGRGEIITVSPSSIGSSYSTSDIITSLHLSLHSPTLLLGTSTSSLHILALPSLLPTRIIPSSLTAGTAGAITSVYTLIRPSEFGTGNGGRDVLSSGLGRNVVVNGGGGKEGKKVRMRIGEGRDVRELGLRFFEVGVGVGGERRTVGGEEERMKRDERERELESQVESLKTQLGKAVKLNETMWKKVVENGLVNPTAGAGSG